MKRDLAGPRILGSLELWRDLRVNRQKGLRRAVHGREGQGPWVPESSWRLKKPCEQEDEEPGAQARLWVLI